MIYLAGLTCTEDTGYAASFLHNPLTQTHSTRAQKGSFIGPAAKEGIALLFPDTSPRGAGVEGEDKDWDFGTGAGFYLDATNPVYATHYNMLTHITKELPQTIASDELAIPIDWTRQSIFGHSMGGHGALTIYLASLLGLGDDIQQKQYRSVSAFAPVSNPGVSPWGIKAFNGYLQGGVEEGKAKYDATELVAKCISKEDPVHVLVDYGSEDQFLKDGQLLPENFLRKARDVGYDEVQVRVRKQERYDHSYYFVSPFFPAQQIHDGLFNRY